MDMWILGREREFNIHGNSHAIKRARKMMALFDWETWSGMYPVNFHEVPEEELAPVLETADFRILSSPVEHLIPTLGLRMECLLENIILAYSSDTNPIETTVRLAAGADVLVHEAAGAAEGHSTAAEAGEIAARAGARSLYLIHYPLRGNVTEDSLVADAKKTFSGKVVLAEDLMVVELNRA
jgi:ribonuclease Z